MRAWTIHRVQSLAFTKPRRWTTQLTPRRALHWSATLKEDERSRQPLSPQRESSISRRWPVFQKITAPERDIVQWSSLLEGALPPHLRDANLTPPDITLGAADVAQIILAAQYPSYRDDEPFDLLYHLGIEQNRWTAVVWLIKKLVDKFPVQPGRVSELSSVGEIWQGVSLIHGTEDKINLEVQNAPPPSHSEQLLSLDELLDGLHPVYKTSDCLLGHDALGQVWRTLGTMTKACAGKDIRPEILEIIAHLHHQEVMPLAIYQAEPHPDKCAIQQPPLIPWSSSRILTSLSDAAWRAHEKLIIEQARAYGNSYPSRPEIPGSSFSINVAGLRPEVWLELILWSCLYGGWVRQGAEILRIIISDRTEEPWTPLSWGDYQKSLPLDYQNVPQDLQSWEFLFKTKAAASMDHPQFPRTPVERTISGEVVNAFIDALTRHVNLGVGARGTDIGDVVDGLHVMKSFLRRHKQTLSFGTWEGLALRLFDSHCAPPESDSRLAQRIVALCDGFGDYLGKSNNENLPAYVKDGTAAMHGILHRALYGQIVSGSFEGALEVFNAIQLRTGWDKSKAVGAFFGTVARSGAVRGTRHSLFNALNSLDLFTSNLPMIEYPSFQAQIPTTTLALFLEQTTEAKAYDFGRWMLYQRDVDGPLIPTSLYADPVIQPVLIRFAAATNDGALLTVLQDSRMSDAALEAILVSQVHRAQWTAATHVLDHLRGRTGYHVTTNALAHAVCRMLEHVPDADAGDGHAQDLLAQARLFVKKMTAGKSRNRQLRFPSARMQSTLSVLAAINSEWFEFAFPLANPPYHNTFSLSRRGFNIILGGVVAAYGSAAGRHLLGIFWPHSARRAFDSDIKMTRDPILRRRMPRVRPEVLDSIKRQRIVITPPDRSEGRKWIFYGAMVPTVDTILIILRKALEEARASPATSAPAQKMPTDTDAQVSDPEANEVDVSPRGMIAWAVRRLAELPFVQRSITEHLDEFLRDHGMEELCKDLPQIYEQLEADFLDDVSEDDKDTSSEYVAEEQISSKM